MQHGARLSNYTWGFGETSLPENANATQFHDTPRGKSVPDQI